MSNTIVQLYRVEKLSHKGQSYKMIFVF